MAERRAEKGDSAFESHAGAGGPGRANQGPVLRAQFTMRGWDSVLPMSTTTTDYYSVCQEWLRTRASSLLTCGKEKHADERCQKRGDDAYVVGRAALRFSRPR